MTAEPAPWNWARVEAARREGIEAAAAFFDKAARKLAEQAAGCENSYTAGIQAANAELLRNLAALARKLPAEAIRDE